METTKREDRFKVVEDKVLKNSYFILDNRFGILLGPYGRDAFEKAEDLNSVGDSRHPSLVNTLH